MPRSSLELAVRGLDACHVHPCSEHPPLPQPGQLAAIVGHGEADASRPRLKAGVSAAVTLEGKDVPNAIHVPRQAVFDKNGKNHVFVKVDDRFEQREVKVEQRTESRLAISGVTEGTEIALVDPTIRTSTATQSGTPSVPAAGGTR